nr:MAG TPA: hypothetical protein [Caudoviricetes sp.]
MKIKKFQQEYRDKNIIVKKSAIFDNRFSLS